LCQHRGLPRLDRQAEPRNQSTAVSDEAESQQAPRAVAAVPPHAR
jgi:hypothetical protein